MSEPPRRLGKLISVHGTSPAFLQKAAVVAMLSFVFFLLMLLAFYLRQQMGYFILSSAFLVVYLFTMIGWWMQKRNVVNLYENGISHRKFTATWDEIESFSQSDNGPITLKKKNGSETVIPVAIRDTVQLAEFIRAKIHI